MAATKIPTSKSVQEDNRKQAQKMLGGASAKMSADAIPKKAGGAVVKKAMGGKAKAIGGKGKC